MPCLGSSWRGSLGCCIDSPWRRRKSAPRYIKGVQGRRLTIHSSRRGAARLDSGVRPLGGLTLISSKNILLAVVCLTLCSCSGPLPWQGWVYPDRNDLTDSIPLGAFSSLEDCRISARTAIRLLSDAEQRTLAVSPDYEPLEQDWECGYKCRPDAGGLNVCERTDK